MPRRKAPKGCFWRGETLWGRKKVKGRDHKFTLRTSDPEVARARRTAEAERLTAVAHYGDDRKRFGDVVLSWTDHHIAHEVSPSTAKRYASSLVQLRPYTHDLYLDQVDRAMISGYVDARRAAGTTTATIRRDLTALSSILNYAIGQDWRPDGDNPALSRLKRLTERRDPIVLPEPKDIETVIQRAPGTFASLIRAAWLTGCRLDELVKAEHGRLDRQRRQLTVIGKGNKQRVVSLSLDAVDLLRSLPVRLGSPNLFWHHNGEPYRNASSRFAAIVKRTEGIRPFRFHDLRHLYAVEYLKNGGNIYMLSKNMGHTHLSTTELYLKFLTPEEALAARYAAGEQIGEREMKA